MNGKQRQILRELVRLEHITESQLDKELAQHIQSKGDSDGSVYDFLWRLSNRLLIESASQASSEDDLYLRGIRIYGIQFSILRAEGKDVTRITKVTNQNHIRRANLSSYKSKITLITTKDCSHSQKYADLEVPTEIAIDNFPFDYELCTRPGGCICVVGVTGIRDENDRLIMKKKDAPIDNPNPRTGNGFLSIIRKWVGL